jgi:hypothetical protein
MCTVKYSPGVFHRWQPRPRVLPNSVAIRHRCPPQPILDNRARGTQPDGPGASFVTGIPPTCIKSWTYVHPKLNM